MFVCIYLLLVARFFQYLWLLEVTNLAQANLQKVCVSHPNNEVADATASERKPVQRDINLPAFRVNV
jgi:hypothetical protein